MNKKIVICTGANRGIGFHYCRQMLGHDYQVVLACRNEAMGQSALESLNREFPNGSAQLMLVDMSDLESIKAFADAFSGKHATLDILHNNAGAFSFSKERALTASGMERHFGTNFVGPFLLTALLFPILKATPDARVVNLSSFAHEGHPTDLNDLQMETNPKGFKSPEAYSRSKWALNAFTFELQRRIEAAKLDMHAIVAHPGMSYTGITQRGSTNAFQKIVITIAERILGDRPEKAARAGVMASLEGVGGEYFGPTGFLQASGKPGRLKPNSATLDQNTAEALWSAAEDLSGHRFSVS